MAEFNKVIFVLTLILVCWLCGVFSMCTSCRKRCRENNPKNKGCDDHTVCQIDTAEPPVERCYEREYENYNCSDGNIAKKCDCNYECSDNLDEAFCDCSELSSVFFAIPGHRIPGYTLNRYTGNAEECKNYCLDDKENCRSAQLNSDTGDCFLKTVTAAEIPTTNGPAFNLFLRKCAKCVR